MANNKGKRAIFGEIAERVSLRLYSWEKPLFEKFKQNLISMRAKKRDKI